MNIDIDELIDIYVLECEHEYDPIFSKRNEKSQKAYSESINFIGKIDFENITEDNIKRLQQVVKDYLYQWGRMQQLLGRPDYRDHWVSYVVKEIVSNQKLKDFRDKDLVDEKLEEIKEDIKKCYKKFENIVGRIGASKILHLVCPHFFPLWDNIIANAHRNEFKTKIQFATSEEYYRFMLTIQYFLKNHEEIFSSLAQEYCKTKLGVIYECLFWAAHRPFHLFLSH